MRREIVIFAIISGIFYQIPALAEEYQVGKAVTLRVNYLTGTSNYSFDNSGESYYMKSGMMVEIIKENKMYPYLNVGFGAAYLEIRNEFDHNEYIGTITTPPWGFTNKIYQYWHVASKQTAVLLLARPIINIDIAQLINIGVETGFGIGYFMKDEKWRWESTYMPDINSGTGNLCEYTFDPYIDLGVNVSWLIDEKTSIGIDIGYFLINSEFGHYNGGQYYRGGLFYKVKY